VITFPHNIFDHFGILPARSALRGKVFFYCFPRAWVEREFPASLVGFARMRLLRVLKH
jgi:hypothetical protein